MKLNNPSQVFLCRGNHETRVMTTNFNFKQECLHKYDQEVYDLFMDSFDHLVLGAIVNNRFLCLHAGLAPSINTIKDIQMVGRTKEPSQNDQFFDLMWSDPTDDLEGQLKQDQEFIKNE